MNADKSSNSQETMRIQPSDSMHTLGSCAMLASRKRRAGDYDGARKKSGSPPVVAAVENCDTTSMWPAVIHADRYLASSQQASPLTQVLRRRRSSSSDDDGVYQKAKEGRVAKKNKNIANRVSSTFPQRKTGSALIKDNDVLFGRGKTYCIHLGNVVFRQLCAERLEQYRIAASRPRKVSIVKEILDEIKLSGGRFLKRNHEGNWRETSTENSKEKAPRCIDK